MSYLVQMLIRASGLVFNIFTSRLNRLGPIKTDYKTMKRYICAYMGPGESNCQGWQMPLHALPTQIVFTRVILVIIFLSRAPRTITGTIKGTWARLFGN